MDESPILIDRRDGFRIITLNRPQRLNAFTIPMHQVLAAGGRRRRARRVVPRAAASPAPAAPSPPGRT